MKRLLTIIIVLLLLVGVCLFATGKLGHAPQEDNPGLVSGDSPVAEPGEGGEEENTPTPVPTVPDEIVINKIDDMVMAKLAVESKILERADLPSDIRYLADVIPVDNAKLSHISAYYTKSDFEQEEYNVLHDYICSYFDEENEKNLKISASKEGKPMRDYFFNTTNDVSTINGTPVTISQYEDKYIATFSMGRYQFDIETNKLSEEELVYVIKIVLENTREF